MRAVISDKVCKLASSEHTSKVASAASIFSSSSARASLDGASFVPSSSRRARVPWPSSTASSTSLRSESVEHSRLSARRRAVLIIGFELSAGVLSAGSTAPTMPSSIL